MELSIFNFFKPKEPYYNGYELLSKMDRFGNRPEVFISTTNRSAGKTTFFSGYCISRFLNYDEKFCLLFRNKYEIEKGNAVNAIFPAVQKLFFKNLEMKAETGLKNVYDNLYIRELSKDEDNENPWYHCGYATTLSASDQIRQFSNMLADVTRIWFDEFQPESGKYLPNEVKKFQSIHTSIARGGGRQNRYLQVIMTANLLDVYNPYYEALDVIKDLDINTNYYRGDGFIIEQGMNQSSINSHKKSAFNRAFKKDSYNNVVSERKYVRTNYNMVEKINNLDGIYIFTMYFDSTFYSCRYLDSLGVYYISERVDLSHSVALACRKDDVCENAVYMQKNRYKDILKKKLYCDQVRFSSIKARNALLEFIH